METGNHKAIWFIFEESSLFNIRWFTFSGKMMFFSFPFWVLYHKVFVMSPCQLKFHSKSSCEFADLELYARSYKTSQNSVRSSPCCISQVQRKYFEQRSEMIYNRQVIQNCPNKDLIRLFQSLETSYLLYWGDIYQSFL